RAIYPRTRGQEARTCFPGGVHTGRATTRFRLDSSRIDRYAMAGLDDFLNLTPAEARAQWRRIAGRVPRERQERFLPVEVILCYGLFRITDPHRFGGRNLDRVPHEVARLAGALQRPPRSLLNKMLNMDGSLANAGR